VHITTIFFAFSSVLMDSFNGACMFMYMYRSSWASQQESTQITFDLFWVPVWGPTQGISGEEVGVYRQMLANVNVYRRGAHYKDCID
jgi:hypothetical protein